MDAKILFKKALEQATATIKWVDEGHYANSTPCTEWDCRTLVNHMLYELSWVPDVLAGKTVKQVGDKHEGDLLGQDHVKSWEKAALKAIKAVNAAKLDKKVHLSYGDVTAEHYITEVGTDLLIHSWDVAQSYWCSLLIEGALAGAVHDFVAPRRQEYASSPQFADPIDVPDDARIQTRILAIVGRREPSV
jgi:uncharacterized protein (TIGR03086 family)